MGSPAVCPLLHNDAGCCYYIRRASPGLPATVVEVAGPCLGGGDTASAGGSGSLHQEVQDPILAPTNRVRARGLTP